MTDSYKITHCDMLYDTKYVYEYFTARKCMSNNLLDVTKKDQIVFVGLQYLIKKLENFRITNEFIEEFVDYVKLHFDFVPIKLIEKWLYIKDKFNGKLPLKIEALTEGTVITSNTIVMTISNTDPECAFLPSYFESYLLHVWYPSTIATNGLKIKKLLYKYLNESADTTDSIDFMLHDFGYRGVSSDESAMIGGCAHLMNFKGTDTIVALDFAKKYYDSNMAGYSVCATEHSIMTQYGQLGEFNVIKNLLNDFNDKLLSIVIDSYDPYNVVEELGQKFRDQINNRKHKLILRPDSGNPIEVIGNILQILSKYFEPIINSKGYKYFNKIGILWGDGISSNTIQEICDYLIVNKWDVSIFVFGMGGGLLQKVNRDNYSWACKTSYILRSNGGIEVFKNPITSNNKKSHGGIWSVVKHSDNSLSNYKIDPLLYSFDSINKSYSDELKLVYFNGKSYNSTNLNNIKNIIQNHLMSN